MWGIYTGKGWFRKTASANRKEVMGWRQIRAGKQAVYGNDPYGGHGYASVADPALFWGEEGKPWLVGIKLLFIRWLSPFLKLV
jgi:hypothetical protein